MKTIFLDCGMGAAGDMLAAALLELTPDPAAACAELNSIGVPGVKFTIETATKCGISGTHLAVTVDGLEEDAHAHEHAREHAHAHAHSHTHAHTHEHHSLSDITHLIDHHLHLPQKVMDSVHAVYGILAEAESHAHGRPVDQIHFHEVGTLDAVADIAAVSLLLHTLAPDAIVASPVHVGSGTVKCAHGILPVPAPATARILRGVPIYSTGLQGELCTPTGAALLRHFATSFGPMPEMRVASIGHGMGLRDFPCANVLRAFIGECTACGGERQDGTDETVAELACDIDDMTGEEIAFAADRLFTAGALDVTTCPVMMKKGRIGTTIRVLCRPADSSAIADAIFRCTSTLGVRETSCRRWTLPRRQEILQSPDGETARRKLAEGRGVSRSKIECEDAARVAAAQGLSLREAREAIGQWQRIRSRHE